MSKCDITDSILRLRTLRDKLCEQEKTWQEAYNVRDYTINQLVELHTMVVSPNFSQDDCKEKLENILECLKIDLSTFENSNT